MRILDRYIGKTVLLSTFTVLMILVTLIMFFTFLDELRSVGQGNYGLIQAFQFILLSTPRLIYELFPMGVLLGCLLSLGAMANNSELIAMRAAGISIRQIVFSAAKTGLLLMVIVVIIGEFISPFMEKTAQQLKAHAKTEKATLIGEKGFWAKDSKTYIHIKQIFPGPVLRGIEIIEVDEKHAIKIITRAKTANYQRGKWLLKYITQTKITGQGVTIKRFKKAIWSSLLNPELLDIVTVKPDALSALGLYKYINYLQENGLDSLRYELAFWDKLVNPLDLMIMLFLAIPFVFGSIRSVSMGQRVLVGIMIGIVFTIINRAFGHIGLVYQLNPLFCAIFPSILFMMIATYALTRVK